MERCDFEIALLEMDAVAEDIENKKKEALQFNSFISELVDENGLNYEPAFDKLAYMLLTTESLAKILVAFDYFKNGKPKRWFEQNN